MNKERELLNKIKGILKMASDLGKDLIIPSDQCLEIINEIEATEMSRAEDTRKMAESDKGLVDVVARLLEDRDNGRHQVASTIEEESEISRVMKAKEESKWKIKEVLLGLDNLVFEGHIDETTYKICTLALERDLEDD